MPRAQYGVLLAASLKLAWINNHISSEPMNNNYTTMTL